MLYILILIQSFSVVIIGLSLKAVISLVTASKPSNNWGHKNCYMNATGNKSHNGYDKTMAR